jgi:hypothetical protein
MDHAAGEEAARVGDMWAKPFDFSSQGEHRKGPTEMDEQTIKNLERAAEWMKTWSAILQRAQQAYWRDMGMIEDGGTAGLNDNGRPKWTSMSFPTKEVDPLIDGLQKLAMG